MTDAEHQHADNSQTLRGRVSQRRLILILGGIMLGMFLTSLQQTIIATGMPRLIAELNGMDRYAWAFTSFMLASTASIPIWGKLSDLYGRRPFYVLGLSLFVLGSTLCGFAQDFTQLIIFRGIQGLGAGATMPIVQAIVGDIFTPIERGKWQGIMMAVFGLSSIIGPTTGGWITDNWGWRWLFFANLPLGLLAVVAAGLALPSFARGSVRHKIDYRGAAMLSVSAVPMLLAFSWAGSQYAWGSPQVVGLLAFSLIAGAAFVWMEYQADEPIISPGLFRNSIFTVSVIVSFLISAGMFGAIMYIPLFIQGVIGQTATQSGAVMTPMMLGFVVSSIIGGQLMSRTGRYKAIAIISVFIAAIGMFLLSRMDTGTASAVVIRNMIIGGLGIGALMSLFTIVVQNAFPSTQLGQVTSSLQFFRSIGGTVGVAILGSIMTGRFSSEFARSLPPQIKDMVPADKLTALSNPQILLSPETMARLQSGFSALGPQGQAILDQVMGAMRQSLAVAIQEVFALGVIMMALALVASFFLKEIPLRTSHHEMPGRPAPQNADDWANLRRQEITAVQLIEHAAYSESSETPKHLP